jgi:hypothetical protein
MRADGAVLVVSNQAGQSQVTMPVCGSMLRTFITILCLTALTGCAACLPGQSRLDKGMVEENSAQ